MNSENGHWKLSDNNESIRIVRFFLTIYLLHNPKHLWCVCALFSGWNSLFGCWVDLNWAQSENEPRRKLIESFWCFLCIPYQRYYRSPLDFTGHYIRIQTHKPNTANTPDKSPLFLFHGRLAGCCYALVLFLKEKIHTEPFLFLCDLFWFDSTVFWCRTGLRVYKWGSARMFKNQNENVAIESEWVSEIWEPRGRACARVLECCDLSSSYSLFWDCRALTVRVRLFHGAKYCSLVRATPKYVQMLCFYLVTRFIITMSRKFCFVKIAYPAECSSKCFCARCRTEILVNEQRLNK